MKKTLLATIAIIAFLTGCSTLPSSGTEYSNNDQKSNEYGYLLCNYEYLENPIGMRTFGVIIKPHNNTEYSTLCVNLPKKDGVQSIMYRMIPGNYIFEKVVYNNYTYKNVFKDFVVEPGKIYYLDNLRIIKVEETSMSSTTYVPSIVDAIAAAKDKWDFEFINEINKVQELVNSKYPTLNTLKIVRVLE